MNLNSNPRKEQLSQLFIKCSKHNNHFLWSDYGGNVNLTGSNEHFQLEKWRGPAYKCMLQFTSKDEGCSLRISATNEEFISKVFDRFIQLWKTGDEVPLRYS